MTTCPVCSGKTRDGLMCQACWRALARDLRSVPALLADLDTAAAKQARLTPPTPGGLASEQNPIGWTAAEAAAALTNSLTTWLRDILAERFAVKLKLDTDARGAASLLLDNEPQIRAHPAAAELHADITHAVAQARRAIDRPEHRAIIDVGPCPNMNPNGAPCDGHLYAFIPASDDAPAHVTCRANSTHRWTADQWLRLGRRILATKDSA